MSTLGELIRYTQRKSTLGITPRSRRKSDWLPKKEWVAKMKKEGKWKER